MPSNPTPSRARVEGSGTSAIVKLSSEYELQPLEGSQYPVKPALQCRAVVAAMCMAFVSPVAASGYLRDVVEYDGDEVSRTPAASNADLRQGNLLYGQTPRDLTC